MFVTSGILQIGFAGVRDKPNAKAGGPKAGGALSDSSEPDGQELLYSARVSFDETKMQIEDKMVNLAPGDGRHRRDKNGNTPHGFVAGELRSDSKGNVELVAISENIRKANAQPH
jgi:hypothetical protein